MLNINVNVKKINIIITSIIITFVIIFSNYYIYSANEESDTTEDNNKEIEEAIAEYDENIYTIEAIVYNKVPLFDINVFSDTSAGVKLKENSIENVTKKTVATWYVAAGTVTFVILAVLLIYTGIMMAISTVAEEKGTYKIRMIGWLKGIVLAFVLHYIIYFIINLNQNIVGIIAQSQGTENSIYNTIKTRAMDTRFSIGMPATIIYITLLVTWVRFLWTYTKRTINVYLLIVLGPLVVAKYTYELSSGKKSKLFSNWLQRFSTAVFIQSIHALFYTIFVSTALELAFENLAGFILALMVLNFMLSADKIFTNIFKFNFSGKDIDDLNRPFKPKESIAGAYLTYSSVKKLLPKAANGFYRAGSNVGSVIIDEYNNKMDKLDKKNGKDNREIVRNKINAPMNAIDDFIINKQGMPKRLKQYAILRRMSRNGEKNGKTAKRIIKKWNNQVGKKFTSNYKFIKDVALGGIESILVIPMWVNYGSSIGMATGIKSAKRLEEATTLGSHKTIEKNKKDEKELDEVINSVETIHNESGKINKEMGMLKADEKKEVKGKIKDYVRIGMDKQTIKKTILQDKSIKYKDNISYNDVEQVVSKIEEKLPEDMTEIDKKKIIQDALDNIKQNRAKDTQNNSNQNNGYNGQDKNTQNNGNQNNGYNGQDKNAQNNSNQNHGYNGQDKNAQNNSNQNNGYNGQDKDTENNDNTQYFGIDEIVEGVNKAILNHSFGEKYEAIGESVEKISSVNSKQSEKSKKQYGELINMNKFADKL